MGRLLIRGKPEDLPSQNNKYQASRDRRLCNTNTLYSVFHNYFIKAIVFRGLGDLFY
jgi:hypothetical protein